VPSARGVDGAGTIGLAFAGDARVDSFMIYSFAYFAYMAKNGRHL
jgi:hypothetical protein